MESKIEMKKNTNKGFRDLHIHTSWKKLIKDTNLYEAANHFLFDHSLFKKLRWPLSLLKNLLRIFAY